MEMMSKLFNMLSIIVCIAMIITLIVFWHDTNLLEYILYECGIFLLCYYSKYIIDAKFLKREIKKEMQKFEDRSNRRNKQ